MTITTEQLLNQKTGRLYLHYFIPTICGTLMGCVYGFADVLFIGRGVGGSALAAVNIATPVFSVFGTLATLLGVGGAVTLSICLGQQKRKEANQAFSLSLVLLAFLSVLILVLGQCFLEPLSLFLGATPGILNMVKLYIGTVLWGTPGFLFNWSLGSFVRNDGNPKLVMWASVVPNLFNVLFDYIFIFPCNMGIFGAALATALSPYLGLMLILLHFLLKRNSIALVNPLRHLGILGRILKNGCGYAILESSNGILILAFNLILIQLGGESSVSSYAILLNIGWLIYSIMQGFVQAAQPIISVNYGAGRISRCLHAFYLSSAWGMLFVLLSMVLLLIDPTPVIRLFAEGDESLVQFTAVNGRMSFTELLFMGVNIAILNLQQACERFVPSLVISLGRGLVFPLIGLLLLTSIYGLDGAWWAITFGEAATLGFSVVVFLSTLKKFRKGEVSK